MKTEKTSYEPFATIALLCNITEASTALFTVQKFMLLCAFLKAAIHLDMDTAITLDIWEGWGGQALLPSGTVMTSRNTWLTRTWHSSYSDQRNIPCTRLVSNLRLWLSCPEYCTKSPIRQNISYIFQVCYKSQNGNSPSCHRFYWNFSHWCVSDH